MKFFIVILIAICAAKDTVSERTRRTLAGHLSNIYNFPYLCSVLHFEELVTTCTILQSEWVIVSVDSMNRPQGNREGNKYYIKFLHELTVNAGNQFIPTPSNPVTEQLQKKKAKTFYVPLGPYVDTQPMIIFLTNPQNLSNIMYDVYGAAIGFGLIHTEPFTWSPHVLPVPLANTDGKALETEVKAFRKILEEHFHIHTTCTVGAWRKFPNVVTYHEVTYIKFQNCIEAYCTYDLTSCFKFPSAWYHMCFQSMMHTDFCPMDRGAVVYCKGFKKSAVAILTTAINCGDENLPGVYTSISLAAMVFEQITGGKLQPGPPLSQYEIGGDTSWRNE